MKKTHVEVIANHDTSRVGVEINGEKSLDLSLTETFDLIDALGMALEDVYESKTGRSLSDDFEDLIEG